MIRQVRLISIAMLVLVCSLNIAQANTGPSFVEQFFETNQAYKNHQFQQAIDGYLHLIENGPENGQVYYNLGNAYFRLGDLGRAILFYERARLLIPRDGDLSFNLSHARSQTRDASIDLQMSSLSGFLGLGSLNRYETFFVFTLLNLLFFSLLCIRLYKKTEWTYYLSIFLAIVISIGGCALALKWVAWANDNRAVVLSEEVVVQAGPDSRDTVLYKLHTGTIVRVERTENDWTLLQLSKDKRGWAESNQLERIIKRKIES
ncbi:tetratricopeptide repeat protein [Thermodesulfobacteriota bacterium]